MTIGVNNVALVFASMMTSIKDDFQEELDRRGIPDIVL